MLGYLLFLSLRSPFMVNSDDGNHTASRYDDKTIPVAYSRQQSYTRHLPPLSQTTLLWSGLTLILGSCFFLFFGLWAILCSSSMDKSTYIILEMLRLDEHYKYLVPLLIPAGVATVIVNWGGLHYFRHA